MHVNYGKTKKINNDFENDAKVPTLSSTGLCGIISESSFNYFSY